MVVYSDIYARALQPHTTLEIWRTDSCALTCSVTQSKSWSLSKPLFLLYLWFYSLYLFVLLDHVIVVWLADSIVLIKQVTWVWAPSKLNINSFVLCFRLHLFQSWPWGLVHAGYCYLLYHLELSKTSVNKIKLSYLWQFSKDFILIGFFKL